MSHGPTTGNAEVRQVPDQNRRREDVRRRILAATIELLAESSYQRLTVEGIAARAGVGKQTIYRWWSSKGAVVLDAFLEHQSASPGTTDPAGNELPQTGDFAADLRRLLRDTVAEFSCAAFEAPYRALVVAIQDDHELADQVTEHLTRAGLQAVRDWLAEARETAQISADVDLDFVVELMFGPIMHRWLLRTKPLTEAFADELTDAVLRVMGHPTDATRPAALPSRP